MILPGYKVFIRYFDGNIVTRYFRCNSKYDLFCYIGWLYSTTMIKIERIDYKYVTIPSTTIWDLTARDLKNEYESEV